MTDADFVDDLEFFDNTPAQAESLFQSRRQAAEYIVFFVNANQREFMCFKQKEATSTLSDKVLKLVDQFTYLGSNISSSEIDVNILLAKAWNVMDSYQ